MLARRNILEFIKNLNREKGVTVMITSHDMDELEQLAARIVLIDHGKIAFDGDFNQLRNRFGDRRQLRLMTHETAAPELSPATLTSSEAGCHDYVFDAGKVRMTTLLEQASSQAQILDVEAHRVPIDDVVADIYEEWEAK